MQPSVATNSGLPGYRPPPKTVVHYADSPWVPPAPSEALPIRPETEPAREIARSSVTEEPKKETKKRETRTIPRRARPLIPRLAVRDLPALDVRSCTSLI